MISSNARYITWKMERKENTKKNAKHHNTFFLKDVAVLGGIVYAILYLSNCF